MLSPFPDFGFAIEIYIAFTSDFTPVSDFRLECSTTTFTSLCISSIKGVYKALKLIATYSSSGKCQGTLLGSIQITFRSPFKVNIIT